VWSGEFPSRQRVSSAAVWAARALLSSAASNLRPPPAERTQPLGRDTDGLGAHSVVEAVGTQESMNQALDAARPGGHVGFVGIAHGLSLDGMDLFWSLAHVHGGPAPVRRPERT
jgi:threonine dehydrogenase-like Zn-dependent dehydrogenase